ncbi:MAG: FdtA/QdtA family cupin domain-containing protein [Bacteroidetes bacterium]|nr:FdtA/QdtA family cupin domain-containing protein [Bacteroidota bacterium]
MAESGKTEVNDCRVIELPKIHNPAGNITALNNLVDLPFNVERVYYLYDVPSGESRGGHAHKELQQLIVAASGSFEVILDDGREKKTVTLNWPNYGLLVVPGIWRELVNFSSGTICLVLASLRYSESDYIRDYNRFTEFKNI